MQSVPKTKQYSICEEELTKYIAKHPIIAKILDSRSVKKTITLIPSRELVQQIEQGTRNCNFFQIQQIQDFLQPTI